MGFFSYLFGTDEKTTKHDQHKLSKIVLEKILSLREIKSLTLQEKKLVIDAIAKAEYGDGKISLSHVDEVLAKLEHEKKISEYDRAGVYRAIEQYFTSPIL